jgi:hypothetical protein
MAEKVSRGIHEDRAAFRVFAAVAANTKEIARLPFERGGRHDCLVCWAWLGPSRRWRLVVS